LGDWKSPAATVVAGRESWHSGWWPGRAHVTPCGIEDSGPVGIIRAMPSLVTVKAVQEAIERLGGEEWFFGQVADDVPLKTIAKELGIGCSRQRLYAWIDAGGNARRERLRAARKEQAATIVENTAESFKTAPADQVEAAWQGQRAKFNQWRASKLDRETFGEEKATVNVNIGSLHTEALRARVLPPEELKAISAPVVEADAVIE
jgi:hypothetical protein